MLPSHPIRRFLRLAVLRSLPGLFPLVASLTGAFAGGAGSDDGSEVRRYCTNVAVAAGDARFAWQTAKLNELEARIKGRVAELEAKTSELRALTAKREALEKEAGAKLVGIYAKMRPETAATQIAGLEDDMAAMVLAELPPQKSSAIFNEIVPERAAKLATLIAGAAPTAPSAGDKKP